MYSRYSITEVATDELGSRGTTGRGISSGTIMITSVRVSRSHVQTKIYAMEDQRRVRTLCILEVGSVAMWRKRGLEDGSKLGK